MLWYLAVAEEVFLAVAVDFPNPAASAIAWSTSTIPMLLPKTGATVLFPSPLLILDVGEPQILKIFSFYICCALFYYFWCLEPHVHLFFDVCCVWNSVPYVPRLFLIWSRTSHNELQLKLFFLENSTPNELHWSYLWDVRDKKRNNQGRYGTEFETPNIGINRQTSSSRHHIKQLKSTTDIKWKMV